MTSPPFAGTRVLLAARFDDSLHAHASLRRRALERLGCTVATINLQSGSLLDRLRRLDLSQRFARSIGQSMPDIVLVVGGEEFTTQHLASLQRITPAVWVCWLPGNIHSFTLSQHLAGSYDFIFAAGTDLAAQLRGKHGRQADYLPLGCDPSFHRPMRARAPFRANVVFAGTATPRREQLLTDLVEFGLAVWGPGWRKTGLRDYCRGELPTAEDYVRAYAGASVGVNIHQSYDPDPSRESRMVNQRAFELAAIGAVQVVDARADLPLHFEEDQELLVYRSGAELKAKVKAALEDNSLREQVGAAGRRRALNQHTYMHRLTDLLHTVTQGL